jgi:hypothetical protein
MWTENFPELPKTLYCFYAKGDNRQHIQAKIAPLIEGGFATFLFEDSRDLADLCQKNAPYFRRFETIGLISDSDSIGCLSESRQHLINAGFDQWKLPIALTAQKKAVSGEQRQWSQLIPSLIDLSLDPVKYSQETVLTICNDTKCYLDFLAQQRSCEFLYDNNIVKNIVKEVKGRLQSFPDLGTPMLSFLWQYHDSMKEGPGPLKKTNLIEILHLSEGFGEAGFDTLVEDLSEKKPEETAIIENFKKVVDLSMCQCCV